MKQIIFIILLFGTCWLGAQDMTLGEVKLQELVPLVVSAQGTGRTTGHVADVVLENNSETTIELVVGPLLIPSNGNSQGYLIPKSESIVIAPKASKTLKLNGYCTNLRLSAAGIKENLSSVDRWVIPDGTYKAIVGEWEIPAGYDLNLNQELGKYPYKLTYPESDRTFVYTIDYDLHANTAADLLLQVHDALEKQYDKMEMLNTVRTPYVIDLKKQKQAVIQHTFWMFTMGLQGEGYLKETFRSKMYEQFNNYIGDQNRTITEQQFEGGVNDFWNTFSDVATAAKVFKVTDK